MMRRHFVWTVVAIVALGPGIGSSARATGPRVFTVPVDEASSFDACDFPVDLRTTGAIKVHQFFDDQGNLAREIANYNLKFTYINVATGDTLTSISAGPTS